MSKHLLRLLGGAWVFPSDQIRHGPPWRVGYVPQWCKTDHSLTIDLLKFITKLTMTFMSALHREWMDLTKVMHNPVSTFSDAKFSRCLHCQRSSSYLMLFLHNLSFIEADDESPVSGPLHVHCEDCDCELTEGPNPGIYPHAAGCQIWWRTQDHFSHHHSVKKFFFFFLLFLLTTLRWNLAYRREFVDIVPLVYNCF